MEHAARCALCSSQKTVVRSQNGPPGNGRLFLLGNSRMEVELSCTSRWNAKSRNWSPRKCGLAGSKALRLSSEPQFAIFSWLESLVKPKLINSQLSEKNFCGQTRRSMREIA